MPSLTERLASSVSAKRPKTNVGQANTITDGSMSFDSFGGLNVPNSGAPSKPLESVLADHSVMEDYESKEESSNQGSPP